MIVEREETRGPLGCRIRPSAGTIFDHYTAEELLLRAVRFHVKYRPRLKPAWAALKRPFGLGSSRSVDLCRAAGLDPDTGEPLAKTEGTP